MEHGHQDQIMPRYDPNVTHVQLSNILCNDEELLQAAIIEKLCVGLFASALLTGSS
jgi:hypothetical protein